MLKQSAVAVCVDGLQASDHKATSKLVGANCSFLNVKEGVIFSLNVFRVHFDYFECLFKHILTQNLYKFFCN